MPWQSSADQTEKKHTDIFSRAREGEAACGRETQGTPTTDSGVQGLSGPCRGRVPKTIQKTVLMVSATRCCKLPDRAVREHLPRTDDHAVAQYCLVVLEVPGRPRSGKLPQYDTQEKRESHRQKSSFQKKCCTVELDRTCGEQFDGC